MNSSSPIDKVVAWGALPLLNSQFNIINGCFKVPMLRGEFDFSIEKFRDLEARWAQDLKNWLCNLYLEIVHIPREHYGFDGILTREFDMEIEYTSGNNK